MGPLHGTRARAGWINGDSQRPGSHPGRQVHGAGSSPCPGRAEPIQPQARASWVLPALKPFGRVGANEERQSPGPVQ